MAFDDALNLPVAVVGHGDIVAHNKGEPPVVVLDIEGFAQSFGQLLHKAEHAVVAALPRTAHQAGLKVQAQPLIGILFHAGLQCLPAFFADEQRKVLHG